MNKLNDFSAWIFFLFPDNFTTPNLNMKLHLWLYILSKNTGYAYDFYVF